MTDNVIHLSAATRVDIPVEPVLKAAIKSDLTGAMVIGWTEGGDLYFASSLADGGDVMWLMELAKQALINTIFEG